MEQAQQWKRAAQEWYAADESKEYVFYAALLLWVCVQSANVPLTAHIASRPDNTIVFLLFVVWFFLTLGASTYWLCNSLRQYTLAQCRRAQQLQGAQLEILQ
jgi:type III secretory pathway component EscS